MTESDPPAAEITPETFVTRAYEAFDRGLPERASWYASMAAVGLMQDFLTVAREGVDYEWTTIELPTGGHLNCVCGATAFTQYPTPSDLPWVICATADCDALWGLGAVHESYPPQMPQLVRSGGPQPRPEPAWQPNDLVRNRKPYPTPIGDQEGELVALLQRPSETRPGWWEAMVLRGDAFTGVMVGQAISLHEGGSHNAVARFPD